MQRKSLSTLKGSKSLERFAKKIKSGKYFRKISLAHLEEILSKGELVSLNADEFLINQKKYTTPKLIILLNGSLVVTSENNFITRLNQTGDVFGEMMIIFSEKKPIADVIAEDSSKLIIIPNRTFKPNNKKNTVSVAYLILTHILAEKLRHTSAKSLLKKNIRINEQSLPRMAIIDLNTRSRGKIKSLVKKSWENIRIIEINSFSKILNSSLENKFDFFIIDPEKIEYDSSKKESIRNLIEICNFHKAPILIISKYCKKEENRKFLYNLGVSDFMFKPFSDFDLSHKIIKFKTDYYLQKELKQVEIAADTDRLTGLANRRKMEEFLDALITIYTEDELPFTIIIADIDNFKHYNDTNGHQMGDKLLFSVASIFKNKIRRGDLASRYGGEEFLLILPNCSKKNAVKIGKNLCKTIEEKKFPFQEKQPFGNLTCTFGLATFPDDAKTKNLLLKKADERLYFGKSSGKNKLISYYNGEKIR